MGLLNQVYLTNDLMNWADWMIFVYWEWWISMEATKFFILGWAGIFWHRLSTNQIVRCFKSKKLKSYMRYQVDFLLPWKLRKISYYFGLRCKILLANQFAGFFTFDWFDLLILEVHCYIVLAVIVAIIIVVVVLYLDSVKIHVNDKTICKSHSLQLGLYTPN